MTRLTIDGTASLNCKGGANMAYQRKTKDEYDLVTDYGYGKEVECTYDTYKEAYEDYKTYRAERAAGYLPTLQTIQIKKRRVKLCT